MNYIYLLSIVLGLAVQNVTKKTYNEKTGGGPFCLIAMTCAAAAVFFTVSALTVYGGLKWNAAIIPYAVGFALFYGTTSVTGVMAYECGPMSLSTLVGSYSLMIPTIYGLIFLHENPSVGLYPGLVMLALSLFLINKKNDSAPVTLKWIICVVTSLLANGICTIVQKEQQIAFEGAYKNEFMILALLLLVPVLGAFSLVREKGRVTFCVKRGWYLGLIGGAFNGMVNLFVMILSGRMAASLMFPVISGGGIVITSLIARFVFREKLSKNQQIGLVTGIIAIVLLNI